jgi:hypothetical protein
VRHERRSGKGPERDIEWPIHGDIRIYTSVQDGARDHVWVEYVVRFTHGRVEWIRPFEEVPRNPDPPDWDLSPEVLEIFKRKVGPAPPAAPPADPGKTAMPSAEEALLQSLRRDRTELEKLLQESSNHWGYEDPVYRFYHQSFKVYSLQHQTESIARRLQALAPDHLLNPWFVQIVESGTGKEFQSEDNARWPEVTRPIVEAFFHARFFLEMAVRYADLSAPPEPLPSGYAALLNLFGLR